MKRPVSILLLVALLLPQLHKMWIIVDFKINQDFIAAILCINKDEPETQCNGKCYLRAQLKKAEPEEPENIPPTLRETCEQIFFVQELTPKLIVPPTSDERLFCEFPPLYTSSFVEEFFHPPELLIG